MNILLSENKLSALLGSYNDCKEYTRFYAKSFYFSSFMLPKEKRYASYAIYTFCRYADNLVDHTKDYSIEEIHYRYSELYNFLDDVYAGKPVKTSAFAETVSKFKIPKHYFTDLIEGVMMDISKKRYSTFMELDTYCYKVASVVGLMMSEVFGYSSKAALPYAVYLGKSMQLTNILRDIHEDFLMERIYLPQDERNYFDYNEEDLKNKVINERFIAMMKFNVERNKTFYELAAQGMPYLTNDGSRTTAVLMYKIYSGILKEIENYNYDIYSGRRYVSAVGKLRMTGAYLLSRSERKRFSKMPQSKHALEPNLNFDE